MGEARDLGRRGAEFGPRFNFQEGAGFTSEFIPVGILVRGDTILGSLTDPCSPVSGGTRWTAAKSGVTRTRASVAPPPQPVRWAPSSPRETTTVPCPTSPAMPCHASWMNAGQDKRVPATNETPSRQAEQRALPCGDARACAWPPHRAGRARCGALQDEPLLLCGFRPDAPCGALPERIQRCARQKRFSPCPLRWAQLVPM